MTAKKPQWLILDVDEGLIRRESSRTAAVAWCKNWAGYVVETRWCFRPGAYRYVFGYGAGDDSESGFSCYIEREDVAVESEWWCVNDVPRFPHADRPYIERNENDQDDDGFES